VDERQELPGIYRFSFGFELGLKGVGKRQIHVVTAQKNVLPDADAVEFQCAVIIGHGDQAEIGGSTPDITDQHDIARTDEGAPLPVCLRDPGVERRLGLLEQSHFAEAGGFRCFGGQISRNRIEGCRNRQNQLSFGKISVPPLRASSIQKRVLQVVKVSP